MIQYGNMYSCCNQAFAHLSASSSTTPYMCNMKYKSPNDFLPPNKFWHKSTRVHFVDRRMALISPKSWERLQHFKAMCCQTSAPVSSKQPTICVSSAPSQQNKKHDSRHSVWVKYKRWLATKAAQQMANNVIRIHSRYDQLILLKEITVFKIELFWIEPRVTTSSHRTNPTGYGCCDHFQPQFAQETELRHWPPVYISTHRIMSKAKLSIIVFPQVL